MTRRSEERKEGDSRLATSEYFQQLITSPAQPQPQLQSKPPLMVRLPLLLTGSGGFSNSQQQITPKMQVSSSSHSCA